MQSSTLVVLLCLIAAVYARARPEYPAVDAVQDHIADGLDTVYDTPVHERSLRTKRGLLLLKKKLLLGALGLKAAKVGAVGGAVAGALALKKKASVSHHEVHVPHAPSHSGYSSHGPSWNVEVQSWH